MEHDSTQRDFSKEFEALKHDLAQVRKDLGNLAEAGVGTATGSAGATRDRLESEVRQLVDRMREVSSTAVDGEREMMDDMRRQVGDKPLTSMLTALGIGFAVGWLASRR